MDELTALQKDYLAKINAGEYDDQFENISYIAATTIHSIIKEKLFDGESQIEKALAKKSKKAKKTADNKHKADEAKLDQLLTQENLSKEELDQREEDAAAAFAKLLHQASMVEPFAFFKEEDVLASVNTVNVIWVRDYAKLTPDRLLAYKKLLDKDGLFYFYFFPIQISY